MFNITGNLSLSTKYLNELSTYFENTKIVQLGKLIDKFQNVAEDTKQFGLLVADISL